MDTAIKDKQVLGGGAFLIQESTAAEVHTPEDVNEEQIMFRDMVRDFVQKKVWPKVIEIDNKGYHLLPDLLKEAGELGILGATLPEQYGGLGVNFNTESLLSEEIGTSFSFGVAVAAHTGIGTLPILYFGNEEQKAKYLPGMITGEIKASYCLTEPGSGSDALAAKTKAVLNEEGTHYILNGQKMWITNAGFADILTVFAKVDGELFTGFLVDADAEGVTLGEEEDKMGIKGSSTRQVFFENVKVPVENVLGKIGEGHKIAFNVLNIGRYKLSAMVIGGAKGALEQAVKYANERHQFKVPIASFGMIKHKLAEMAVRIHAVDCANFRTSGLITDRIAVLKGEGMEPYLAKLQAAEEYSIECAMLKVAGSEALDYVVDENVQVHGGMGFSEEGHVARGYRDSRINRIFEGTNEINRLLSVGMLLRKAFKGELDLMGPAMAVQKELMAVPDFGSNGSDDPLYAEKKAILNGKKAILMVAGAAAQKFMQNLEKEQEIMMYAADMLIELFCAESAILRAEKLINSKGEEAAAHHLDLARVYLHDTMERMHTSGKRAICGFAEGDELRMMLLGLKRFTKMDPYNTIAARRRIADKVIEAESYCF
jgi:alkylation response protein AidB-like acyl-CoA dehydrogenase